MDAYCERMSFKTCHEADFANRLAVAKLTGRGKATQHSCLNYYFE